MNSWIRQHVAFSLPLMYGGSKQAYWDESGFGDPRVTAAIKRLQSTFDHSAQKQAVADAYEIINRDSGDLIPCHGDRIWVTKPTLRGLRLNWQKVASFTQAYLT
jgi:ABC-type transport system substrate-binding protein